MIDTFNLPNRELSNQAFYTQGTGNWQVWQKPNGAKMISILVIGGGGGGGSGQQSTGSSTRRGGGGGGSSAVSLGVFSATLIPDTLFILVGPGGIGGSGNTGSNGSVGSLSYVSVQPDNNAVNILVQSGAAAAGGGNAGSSLGTAGIAGTAWAGAGNVFNELGFATSSAGQAGTLGQQLVAPSNLSVAGITTGGAGGAGTNVGTVFNGASIVGSGFIPTISGGTGNVNQNGGDGSGGFVSLNSSINSTKSLPIFFTGGAGGGSSNNVTGGSGGSGGYGSGGGGGGAGVTNSAGRGGRGGDGIVIITCY